MKFRLVGAQVFHAGRQTEMTKLIVAFRNFSNASKYYLVIRYDAYFDMMYCIEQKIKSYMKKGMI